MPKPQDDADIFDRSFKQIIGSLSPKALIHFINALFGTNHPPDSEVKRLNTEHIDKTLRKRQSDEVVSIARCTYLIEEQTTEDANMAIRVFEYGYAQALTEKETKEGLLLLPFPRMIVIYLEVGSSTPDVLTLRMKFPDETEHDFKVETFKLLERTVEELEGRGLIALLPFYIIRLRKAARQAKSEGERARVEAEFRELGVKLKDAIERSKGRGQLSEEDMVTVLERLSGLVGYVGRSYKSAEEVKEMVDTSLMGYGQVLALRYERKGARKGARKGERKGERKAKLEAAGNALSEGLSMEQAARIAGIPVEELTKHLAAASNKTVARSQQ